jgi:hypothetical protein
VLKKTLGKRISLSSVIYLTLGKEAFCRVLKKHSATLPSVKNKTLGKELLWRVFFLPRVFCLALVKELLWRVFYFTKGFLLGTRQRASLPSAQKNTRQNIWHSAKSRIPVVRILFEILILLF